MIDTIWAKSSGETLAEHTIACLKAAQAILNSLPISLDEKVTIKKDVLLAVAMHDIGKAATGFQKVLRSVQRNWQGKRHEIISASFASGIDGVSSVVIFAILTHHKSIPTDGITQVFGCLPPEQIPLSGIETKIWKEMVHEWEQNIDSLKAEWEKICSYLEEDIPMGKLKILSLPPSWLESTTGNRGQRKSIPFLDRYYASIVRGLTIASDHLGSVNKIPPSVPELSKFSVLQQSTRPFQNLIGKMEASAILRAPTGSGKTEAALLWAQRNQRPNGRLFYILPYTASINAMYTRLARILGDGNVGLMHHRATSALYDILENDNDISSLLDKQQTAKTLAELAHEIWFPIRVCTPHQLLRYTLRGKGWEYMLAEFPNACFIFDEIHAYDPRVVGLTLASARLFSRWGAKCLFLSATLPSFLRSLIIDSMGIIPFIEPNLTQEEDRKILARKRHNVEIKDGTIKDNIGILIDSLKESSSTLIVCNHVKTSQEIYTLLKERFPEESIKLLHSRFNQEDRNRIENEVVNNILPKVLVATQVVEVSLDMDFEQAFFEPAPIDALIQRMGRVNRLGNRLPAKVVIFTRQVNPYHLYCECSGENHQPQCRVKLTIDELHRLENPISEKDLVDAADIVYGKGYQGDEKVKYEEGLNHPDITNFEDQILAGAHQDWVEEIIDKTDGIVEMLPKCLFEEYNSRKEKGLWLEANKLLVPVRTKSIAWLKSKIDMTNDPWIVDMSYTSHRGLEIE